MQTGGSLERIGGLTTVEDTAITEKHLATARRIVAGGQEQVDQWLKIFGCTFKAFAMQAVKRLGLDFSSEDYEKMANPEIDYYGTVSGEVELRPGFNAIVELTASKLKGTTKPDMAYCIRTDIVHGYSIFVSTSSACNFCYATVTDTRNPEKIRKLDFGFMNSNGSDQEEVFAALLRLQRRISLFSFQRREPIAPTKDDAGTIKQLTAEKLLLTAGGDIAEETAEIRG